MSIIVKKYEFRRFIFEYKTAGEFSWYRQTYFSQRAIVVIFWGYWLISNTRQNIENQINQSINKC